MVSPLKILLLFYFTSVLSIPLRLKKCKDQKSSGGWWYFGKEERLKGCYHASFCGLLFHEVRKAILFQALVLGNLEYDGLIMSLTPNPVFLGVIPGTGSIQ